VNELLLRSAGLATTTPLIELTDIRKTFFSGEDIRVDALRGVTLSIYPGEFVAIMGASGSGKSTLMNLLGCLDHPTSGSYVFAGHDVATLDSDSLAWLRREAFGFIFQSYNLLPSATAEENVEIPAIYAGLGHAERRARAETLLTALGLGERLTHRPSQLSGGQQQRVSIARALMNGGKVILADEPTGALDSKSGAEVMALLKDLAADGHTVILITHDPNVAAHAHRVIELKDGEVVKDSGTDRPTELAADKPIEFSSFERPHWRATVFAGLDESLKMAMRALRTNLFRTVLTLLGIVIGVGSVVAMLAIGEGAKQQVIAQIGQMGTNLLSVRPQFRNARGYNGPIATLTPEDAKAIAASIPNVRTVMPDIQGGNTVRYADIDYQTMVTATTDALPSTRSWAIARGAFFTAKDETDYATVAVIGETVRDALFADGENPIGKYILIKNVPFQVIGVMASKGATAGGNDTDDVVFVPLTTGMLRVFGQRFVRTITVAVDDLDQMRAVQDNVMALLKQRHYGATDFQVRNMADIIETATAAQNTMTVLLGSVAAISLLVGGIGIMNIMLVSVTERTREIGIRMATGARQRDILQQFLSEAVAVSAIGGIVGVAGGIATGLIIRSFDTPVAFTPGPMILAFCCAAATGLIFGYAPAKKAAKLDPVVALANE
jgi:macrolide transport system ATP-binding/permease protein